MTKILLTLIYFCSLCSFSQTTDTLKVLSYNLLNFPSTSQNRIDTLKDIITYVKPDIFIVCELTSGVGADDILFNALNVGGETSYNMANYVNGPNTQNMLYYNVLKEQNEIATVLRDINEYVLYYLSTDIATTTDTTFFYVYMCHLKAGLGFEAQRNDEANSVKSYMATRPNRQNVIFGGDFNFYGSITEPAWNTMLSGSSVTLLDPINTPGDWHINSGYASIHTQSTRTTSFDGGATGGMDDRFDLIFISPDLTTWASDAKYITGTYKALGQDGLHYNDAFIDPPWNTSEPASIIWNLYNMSDHLPVYMEIEVQKVSMGIEDIDYGISAYLNKDSNKIIVDMNGLQLESSFYIYDMNG